MRAIFFIVLVCLIAATGPVRAQGRDLGPMPPGQFDFYVLALTWVPSFCATHADPRECNQNLGFALHGLWPESRNGYPSDCPSFTLTAEVRAANASLFASPGMIRHEWTKHGTCSGLRPTDYFALVRARLGALSVPAEYRHGATVAASAAPKVKAAFLAANPALMAESLVLACANRQISELHICLGKDGAARTCEAWERAEDNCH